LDSRIYYTPHTIAAYHGSSGVSEFFGTISGLFNYGVSGSNYIAFNSRLA